MLAFSIPVANPKLSPSDWSPKPLTLPLNEAAKMLRAGVDLTKGRHRDLIGQVQCEFRPVDEKWIRQLMVWAIWYYDEDLLSVLPLILEPVPADIAARVASPPWRINAERCHDAAENDLRWDRWYSSTWLQEPQTCARSSRACMACCVTNCFAIRCVGTCESQREPIPRIACNPRKHPGRRVSPANAPGQQCEVPRWFINVPRPLAPAVVCTRRDRRMACE
jgi:hypothetical protein